MTGSILSLNAGSSSIKFALFDTASNLKQTVRGEIEDLDFEPHMVARDAAGRVLMEARLPPGFDLALHKLLDFADAHLGRDGLVAAGHRIVHGGADHIAPEPVTPTLMTALKALTPLDPLPGKPQIAVFDTAFHHTMPSVATRFALPRAISAGGVRRYGFHGLSYEYIAGRLAQQSPILAHGRVIVAHLGSGASMCALKDGASIETTTGFSALDGLVMASRCGQPGPACAGGDRPVHLPHRRPGRVADQRTGRIGRPGLHRRYRRERPGDPSRGLRPPGLDRNPARQCRQRGRCRSYQRTG